MTGAGLMTERVTFQRRIRVDDGGGGFTVTWEDLATDPHVWAKVSFKSAREGLSEGRVVAAQMTVFEIYNRGDLSEMDRLIWNGERFNIRALRRYGSQPILMWIDAERGVGD